MSQKEVYVYAKWKVKEGNLPTVLNIMKEVAQKSSQEEGNLFYKLHQSQPDENLLILFEGYINEDAVEIHRNSEYFKKLVLEQIVPLLDSREVILMNKVL
ncbi:antibiotic biosynthesis monooxygenase [Chryseobacterium sp. T16E-39]|uniref:putative quinol monooxygenase n=1 Tax=Chryseobacterium sp. T16E-39 TaxID=2015076 RepID=UPI000B5B14DF|nr:putative quinol monooxygenase [Chryseobacterium sp. T16E-39]ASK29463.1 antibiotic biosynthesis monooxygenase [Chryseobacterium sp. T16E-39]